MVITPIRSRYVALALLIVIVAALLFPTFDGTERSGLLR